MLNSPELPKWAASIIDHIQQSDFAKVELVILNAEPQTASPKKAPLLIRLCRRLLDKRERSTILFDLYTRFEARFYRVANDPLSPVNCTGKLTGCRTISIVPISKGFTHRFSNEDVNIIRSHDLDVILRFGFKILRGDILQVARYGIWSYHHGDNDYYRGSRPCFWELYERHPLSGVILQVLTEALDDGMVLCKANLKTVQGISVSRNRVQPYWTGSWFVINKLHELHQYGWERIVQQSRKSSLVPGRKPLYRTPTNGQMMGFLLSYVVRGTANRALSRIVPRVNHWRTALRIGTDQICLEQPDLRDFQWIGSPKRHFYADPFLFNKDGRTWLFFEDYSYTDDLGVIACAEVGADGQISAPRTVLATGYHLSYPFVFEDEDQIYMIPESGARKTVELYRAGKFPDRWQLEKTLFSGIKAVDTTVWVQDGIYWFFVTLLDPPEAGPQLFLFYSESLMGEWIYHPGNPICSDVRYARGAGRIFWHNGRRIRPCQDESRGYGCACHFREIVELTKTSYAEIPVGSIQPTWEKGLTGIHTYNRCGLIEVIDARQSLPERQLL